MKSYQIKKRKQLIIALVCCIVLLLSATSILAATLTDSGLVDAGENQYLELKAVEVNDIDGQNKQVIMQLWGHNLEFRRI